MVKSNLALLLVPFLLVGCATTQEPGVRVVIERVEVPIEVPCKAKVPNIPGYNFDGLTTDNDIYEKVRALLADRLLSKAYQDELLASLNSCIK